MEFAQKTKLNILINIFSFIAFLISFFSGVVLWTVLPYGGGLRLGKEPLKANIFWGLHRQDWLMVHIVFCLIFSALAIVHIILHWDWIKSLPKLIKEYFLSK